MIATIAYSAGAAFVIAATAGRPFWWAAVGLAAVSVLVSASGTRSVRERFAPLVIITTCVAVLAVAPVVAAALGLIQ